ncbi:MAG TPA: ABC transporter substrate-binding protein, partial [Anaerolineae bacterium]
STQPWLNSIPGQIILAPSNRADLQRYYNENFQAFALGTKPLNDQTWSDFLKGLDANVNAAKWEADTKKLLQDAGVLKK